MAPSVPKLVAAEPQPLLHLHRAIFSLCVSTSLYTNFLLLKGTESYWSYSQFNQFDFILRSESRSVMSLCDPMDDTVHGILWARILEWVPVSFSRKSSHPTLQVDSLLAESPGKPKNTGVDSLSLVQGIFSAQELNQGILHCRWILYQCATRILSFKTYMLSLWERWMKKQNRKKALGNLQNYDKHKLMRILRHAYYNLLVVPESTQCVV